MRSRQWIDGIGEPGSGLIELKGRQWINGIGGAGSGLMELEGQTVD